MSDSKNVGGTFPVGVAPVTLMAALWGAPAAFLSVFVLGEVGSPFGSGPGSALDIGLVCAVCLGTLLCMIPHFLFVRKITITEDAIVGFRYLGPKKPLEWRDIEKIDLREVKTQQASKKTIRLTSKKGQRLTFQSHISNFDQLLSCIEALSPVPVLTRPARPAVGPYEA